MELLGTGCIVFTKNVKNRETKCGLLFSETPICRIWVEVCSKTTKIFCWVRQDQIKPKENFMLCHSISASVKNNERRRAKGHCMQDVQNEFVESRREQIPLQEESLQTEKSYSFEMHEIGKMKRAQIQQLDSPCELRENHETIQQFTSQMGIDEFSEQFFHDIESNFCVKNVSRFHSTCYDSEFSSVAQPR